MAREIIEAKPMMLAINLERPFPLGFGTLESLPRVLLQIKALDEGKIVEGVGEASIDFPFADYDAWDIYWALSSLDLVGNHIPENIADVKTRLLDTRSGGHNPFPAACAALNMALDDLQGKIEGKSVLDLYSQKRASGKALVSIGFQEDTALLLTEVDGIFQKGYIPKPKVGQGLETDIKTIREVAKHSLECGVPFALDFNATYEPEEFRKLAFLLRSAGVDLSRLIILEQPTSTQSGVLGLASAKKSLEEYGYHLPVMADESFVTLEDAIECVNAGLSLNFKIHKVGGLFRAREIEKAIVRDSAKAQPKNMIGGTFPTAIGRVYDQQSAAILETTTLPGDGWEPSTDWFTGEKHIINEQFTFDPQKQEFLPIKGNGLGITPNWQKIKRFEVENPREEYRKIRSGKSGDKLRIDLKPGQDYSTEYRKRSGRPADWNL